MLRLRLIARLLICCCSLALAACGINDEQPRPNNGDTDEPAFDALVRLANCRDVCGSTSLVPAAGEEEHLSAARLTPSAYPFEVTRIRYRLGHGPAGAVTCHGGLPHRVELYRDTASTPAATPTAVATWEMPAVDGAQISDEGRIVVQDLPMPVLLSAGEHLFVAIKFAGTFPEVLCVPVNTEDPFDVDRNFWSNAAAPPYAWTPLHSFGLTGNILIAAYGYARP